MFWFYGSEVCGLLAPQPEVKPAPSALEGKVSTTGPPGKALNILLNVFLDYRSFTKL